MFPDLRYGVTVHADEGDMDYISRLIEYLVNEHQAQFAESATYGPVGSQVINIWPFSIEGEKLQILDETYMGTQLQGPKQLVDRISGAMKSKGLIE